MSEHSVRGIRDCSLHFDESPNLETELKYVTHSISTRFPPQVGGDTGGLKSLPGGEGFREGRSPAQRAGFRVGEKSPAGSTG